ncbi:MAG: HAD family hydrolase [archaeon]
MKRRYDLIMFDLDGTLIDNRAAIRDNFNHALEAHGLPQLGDGKIDSMIGTPLAEMFEKILPKPACFSAEDLAHSYMQRYLQTSHIGTHVLEDVVPTLERLRSDGFRLAVATTKVNEAVQPLLQKMGLYDYFDMATGRREGMKNKPHPDILNYIMKELKMIPQRSVMVGDTPTDVMTARNAGVSMIGVTSSISLGFTTLDRIRDAQPDIIIPSLHHLFEYLYVG